MNLGEKSRQRATDINDIIENMSQPPASIITPVELDEGMPLDEGEGMALDEGNDNHEVETNFEGLNILVLNFLDP